MKSVEVTGPTGALIVNADDWGRDYENTTCILDCFLRGAVSSVSAMVFMEDSHRAAVVASEQLIDAGLHLNLTSAFTSTDAPAALREHQSRVAQYLNRHRFAQLLYHPSLSNSFCYSVGAQIDEYARLFGREPARIDGHHHMHLSANVLLGRLLPRGVIARRNFSFRFGERSVFNVGYRRLSDRLLASRNRLADYMFSLRPIDSGRLQKILTLAKVSTVELETHPVNADEYSFLTSRLFSTLTGQTPVARGYQIL